MSLTPVEDAVRFKARFPSLQSYITEALKPSTLEIYNDSAKHAHHKAMQGSISQETHFRIVITSDAFTSKMQPARHRMVYALLKEELDRAGGIHALQLKTMTPQEEDSQVPREKVEREQATAEAEKG
ncbi:MAG: hypothetical protein Q9184_004769 [Pyrenodesmia sp. 2 TL-2023]